VLPTAARLRSEFSFIPHARVDDVMVSYAAPGGGVGPHFDSYDVFLVQGAGERRWRLSAQRDLDLVMNAPLKVLRRFRPEREVTATPGDVLYLPPHWAHDGIALRECITCSVGFRAPAANELATHFLEFLQDRLALEGRYADPDLEPARRPGRIPDRMIERSARALDAVRWSDADVAEFLGRYLTEPKGHVVFQRPARRLELPAFVRATRRKGVQLAAATRMLYRGRDVFINGERSTPSAQARRALQRLADARQLPPGVDLGRDAAGLLYQWYTAGYIRAGTSDER
jgi:50S ribosomal protein L16 3-hydroxylase